MKHILQQDHFSRGDIIKSKINNNTISKLDMIAIDDIDKSITIYTLKSERSLKASQASHTWSPTLTSTILYVQL